MQEADATETEAAVTSEAADAEYESMCWRISRGNGLCLVVG